jgi:hypothetical protein
MSYGGLPKDYKTFPSDINRGIKMKKDYIDTEVSINNEVWRVAEKAFRFGREWQYTLSHENIDGTYESMQLNEAALERLIESGSKVMGELK